MENAQLARLVEEHGDTLLRMCFLYLRDVHLAQDAVQDAFVRAATTPAVFESRSSEKTWLCRIAINVCKNYRRSAWFRKTQPLDLPEELPAPEPRAADDTLVREIAALPEKYRAVVLLYYYQELKTHEIADILGIAESTVSVRLRRARERLKSKLKGWYYDE